MAQLCAGDTAAGDPTRSGIVRANAYFNAAAAYNVVAASGSLSGLCDTSTACSQTALNLLDKSMASQQDNQIRPSASASQTTANERFVLRRKLERARALHGLALGGTTDASCGTRTACLTAATQTLDSLNVEPGLASEDAGAVHLSCEVLDVRWRVNAELGREREYRYVDDLRRIEQACPAFAASASDKLAEISFERAERVRESLAQDDPPPSVEAALGAITDYRDAAAISRFELPAHRGMGSVYRALATREPAGARTYLERAIEAYGDAVELGTPTAPVDARASDLEHLGTSLIALAPLTGRPGSQASLDVYADAAEALQDSVDLAPTPARYLSLGEARGAAGQYEASVAAYQTAIASLSGTEKAKANLALVGILDKKGDAAGALQLLKQIAAENADNPEVQYEIGSREFGKGNLNAALTALRPVVNSLQSNDAADAHYMISVAEVALRKPDWQKRAFDHAERAVALNARDWTYKRQACLANILRGGKAVKNGSSLVRCPDIDTPEAKLLRGMYFLKQAQTMDVSAYDLASQTRWRSVLRSAEEAFLNGQDALQEDSDGERLVWFDDLQANVDLGSRLGQGLTVIQRCNREITIGPNDPAWRDLNAFFGYYGVLKCS